jgi:hypothetical protein
VFHLKRRTNCEHTNPFAHETTKQMLASTVFLQPYPVAAGEIGRAVVSSVLSLDEYLLQTDILSARNFVTSRCIVVLFGLTWQ